MYCATCGVAITFDHTMSLPTFCLACQGAKWQSWPLGEDPTWLPTVRRTAKTAGGEPQS
jgi:hypothetical protein